MDEELKKQTDLTELNEGPEKDRQEADPEERGAGQHRSPVRPFLCGFFAALLAVLVGVILIRGYIMVSLGRLGVLTIRMPYYKYTAETKSAPSQLRLQETQIPLT